MKLLYDALCSICKSLCSRPLIFISLAISYELCRYKSSGMPGGFPGGAPGGGSQGGGPTIEEVD